MHTYKIADIKWEKVKAIESNAPIELQVIVAKSMEGEFYGGMVSATEEDLNNLLISLSPSGVLNVGSKLENVTRVQELRGKKNKGMPSLRLMINLSDIERVSVSGGDATLDVFDNEENPISVNFSGAGTMEVKCTRKVQKYNVSGAGVLNVKVMGRDINVKTSGAGQVLLEPLHDVKVLKVENLKIDMSGAGQLSSEVKALNLNVTASGVGSVQAKVINKAKVDLSGVGKVNLVHDGKIDLNYNRSGMGQLFINGSAFIVPGAKSGKPKNLMDTNMFGNMFDNNNIFGNVFNNEDAFGDVFGNIFEGIKKTQANRYDENSHRYNSSTYNSVREESSVKKDVDNYEEENYPYEDEEDYNGEKIVKPVKSNDVNKEKKVQDNKVNTIKDRIRKIL